MATDSRHRFNHPVLQRLATSPGSWVTLLLLMVNLPHFGRYQLWSIGAIVLLSGWRLLMIATARGTVNRLLSALITISLAALVYRQYQTLNGIEAGTNLLSLMLFCKLLESRSHRDNTLLIQLSFFVIATNFLFSQSIPTALYMVLCILLTLVTLMTLNQQTSAVPFKVKLKTAIRMTLFALPLMAIVFVFFPRISGALWKTARPKPTTVTGLSDHMEPGNISELISSNELAFRVSFEDKVPPPAQRYWRALVFWNFDGKRWTPSKWQEPEVKIDVRDEPVNYTINAEPSQQKWLFLLDLPFKVSGKLSISSDFTTRARKNITQVFQYSASSSQNIHFISSLHPQMRELALALPGINAQTIRLARNWRSQSRNDQEVIQRALMYFSQNNFSYSLRPPPLNAPNITDQFLFQTRTGFCEHYANAFAVLMRAAGIPSRVVTGYQGGTINPLNNTMVIDQSMAHAWNEVWLDGQGWVRVDPTSVIAPNRIQMNLESAIKNKEELPLHLQISSELLQELGWYFDYMEYQWNQWVIDYHTKKQKDFISWLTGSNYSLKQIAYLFIKILLAALVILSLLYFARFRFKKEDAVTAEYRKFCHYLERYGFNKPGYEGAVNFNRRISETLPMLKAQLNQITDTYTRLRYAPNPERSELESLRQLVKQFTSRPSNRKILKACSEKARSADSSVKN